MTIHHSELTPSADVAAIRAADSQRYAEFDDEAILTPMTDEEMDAFAAHLLKQKEIQSVAVDRLQILKDLLSEVRAHEQVLVESEFYGTADLLTEFRHRLARQIRELELRLVEENSDGSAA